MLVATRGADTLGGVPAPGYRLLRLPTVGTITGKLILVPKPPLPSSYPSEARQESRAGGLGPAAHRNSYEVVTTYRRGASHHDQERYGAQDNLTSLTGKLSLIELLLYLLKRSSQDNRRNPRLLRPE